MIQRIFTRPERLFVGTFAGMVLAGTILLALPFAQTKPVSLLDAFFTSTSAVCVTGLTTVETVDAYSRFGQTVILVLIQLGGLGLMTFGAIAAEVLRLPVSFRSQAMLRSTFFQEDGGGDFARSLRRILLMTLLLEAVGAFLLYQALQEGETPPGSVFEAAFLSISAFCNAGFSVYRGSAIQLRDSTLAIWTIMALIALGGLGYPVLFEAVSRGWMRLRRRRPPVHWTLHARIVLMTSGGLILGGALALTLLGLNEPQLPWVDYFEHSLFQSVTARTAGFNTVDIGRLPLTSVLVLIPLMFIGGSPGSAAGGVKTTVATVWLARLWARLRGQEGVVLLGRRIPQDLVRRAALVIAAAGVWNIIGVMLLVMTESRVDPHRFEVILFEQISAFATVGLSMGITPELTVGGKLWIILSMFVGRVGPLTAAFVIVTQPRPLHDYPVERVMVG